MPTELVLAICGNNVLMLLNAMQHISYLLCSTFIQFHRFFQLLLACLLALDPQMALPKSLFAFCFGDDFSTRLRLPNHFVEYHGLNRRPQLSLRLKTQPAARSWDVKMEKIRGEFYIADGWSKFVKDNGLLQMKLLLFHLVDDSTLHVSIFGHDSRLELPARMQSQSQPKPKRATAWRMVKKLKEEHFLEMRFRIPKVLAEGILGNGKMKMKDWKGMKWEMKVRKGGKGSFAFTGEWKAFVKANKLVTGAILLFSFAAAAAAASATSLKVKLMEPQAGEKMLNRANHGGILPS